MLYFAYGSNINLLHFHSVLSSSDVDPAEVANPRRATLMDHCLRTNYFSTTHAAGACNIEPANGCCVEGVLMRISQKVLDVIRLKEGWPNRYEEVEVRVTDRLKKRSVTALTYVVTPTCWLPFDLPVTKKYRRLILDGAKAFQFSPAYQKFLGKILRTVESERISREHFPRKMLLPNL